MAAMGLKKRRRVQLIAGGAVAMAAAVSMMAVAFNDAIIFFVAPVELVRQVEAGEVGPERTLRLGGLVVEGTIIEQSGGGVRFDVTDCRETITVAYNGVLPDLFREGQVAVSLGRFEDGVFQATQVLAKHDEGYRPPEVQAALPPSGTCEEQT